MVAAKFFKLLVIFADDIMGVDNMGGKKIIGKFCASNLQGFEFHLRWG